ncbi:sugar O-acetyltransferase [Anaeromassilibacillus sp. An200]|uniref:sugar O-acetyltransferase n=1 Tax=Anaeromassilibacillus sp. An200 TaxID=1965587 RepID=UPI000B3748EF|nr:sugar O-acetyltransferase [Anaeromassilibacillus sp. An200]OUP07327.1 maltose acetyltransferase [Anaeromassilibacillus sp. An200]
MTEQERMLAGKLFYSGNSELRSLRNRARELLSQYNSTGEDQKELRKNILAELLGTMGTHVFIKPPFRCSYGTNIHIGNHFYANMDCLILDSCPVQIGSNVMFGPRVNVFTDSHPLDPIVRTRKLVYGKPVIIGDRVWIGGGAILCPGVQIGKDSVIGAGSVVTHDIPPRTVAAGNPCRVIRKLTDADTQYWQQMQAEYDADPDICALN